MRILIVHNILNDSVSVSGVLKHYAFMANAWIESGHQTDFVVAKAGFPQLRKLAPKAGLVSSDSLFDATRNMSKTWQNMPAFLWRMWNAHWLRLRDKYDVVYASGPFIFEVYAARVLARRMGAKWAAKVQHVLHSQPKREGIFNRMFLQSERISARWMNRDAATVMCLSKVVQEDYRKLEVEMGLEPAESVQVGCGIDFAAMIEKEVAEAGPEAAAAAGDDRYPHVVVGLEIVNGLADFLDQRCAQRVQGFRAVQGDGRNAILHLPVEMFRRKLCAFQCVHVCFLDFCLSSGIGKEVPKPVWFNVQAAIDHGQ